jgi:hypothetical protein
VKYISNQPQPIYLPATVAAGRIIRQRNVRYKCFV